VWPVFDLDTQFTDQCAVFKVLLMFSLNFLSSGYSKDLKLSIYTYYSIQCAVVRSVGPNSATDLQMKTDGCFGTSNVVRSLEHVQVVVTLSASQRGKVELSLTSPSGTRQILFARRHVDVSAQGLNGWVLMTVHCWGEDPRGNWTLTVSTTSSSGIGLQYFLTFVNLVTS